MADGYFYELRELTPTRSARMRGQSWHPGRGCPGVESLVVVVIAHWDFDARVTQGELEVARELGPEVGDIFGELFAARFPIARMRPMHRYQGDDDRSMADNNTSAFNCRNMVGGSELSVHSFGRAIDINPVQNPYETCSGLVLPPNALPYSRKNALPPQGPGVIEPDGPVVRAFESRGWTWGGRWQEPLDSHHFEKL